MAGRGRGEFHLSFCVLSQQNTTSTWCKAQRAADPEEILLLAHLPNHNRVVVETLHEEFDGTGGQDPVIPQEQGQEANAYVFKLPGPEKKPNIQNKSVNTNGYVLVLLRN